MITMHDKWSSEIEKVSYGYGYDDRIHALQICLLLIARRVTDDKYDLSKVSFSNIKFGYYDTNTEEAIKVIKKAFSYRIDGNITKEVYKSIFDIIKDNLFLTVVKNKDALKIVGITQEMQNSYPELQITPSNNIYLDTGTLGESMTPSGEIGVGGNMGESYYNDGYAEYYNPSYNDYSGNGYGSSVYDIVTLNNYNTLGAGGLYKNNNVNTQDVGYSNTTIDNMLANSLYYKNIEYDQILYTKADHSVNIDGMKFNKQTNKEPYFSSFNSSLFRKSGYDIVIVYGANGQYAKKIVKVMPRNKTQQIDATGEAIYEIIEFVARDIHETDNYNMLQNF